MRLFQYEGYNLTISEEALLLVPFKKIWKRDRSDGKRIAQMELGYIYFMEDPRSDYQMYLDRAVRDEKVREGEGMPKEWKPDSAVKEAMKFYTEFKTDAAMLLEDLKGSVQNIRTLLKGIHPESITDLSVKLTALEKITTISTKIPKLAIEIMEAEKKMNEEIQQADKLRGGAEKAMFEDV